mmetsp:Transcript_36283/g.82698  ORF Transcript_36283/g.82698 Transcript_36283/m.82698 type:complete len:526 (-) Transcript_36283:524-2101(-)
MLSLRTQSPSWRKKLATTESERASLQQLSTKQAGEMDKLKVRQRELEQEAAKAEDAKESAVKQVAMKLKDTETQLMRATVNLDEASMVLRVTREAIDKTFEQRAALWTRIKEWKQNLGEAASDPALCLEAARSNARATRQLLGEQIQLLIIKHLVAGDGEFCINPDEFKDLCTLAVQCIESLSGSKSVYVALTKHVNPPEPDDQPPVGMWFEYLCASSEKTHLEGERVPKGTPSYQLITENKHWVELKNASGSQDAGGYAAQALVGSQGEVVGFLGMDTLSQADKVDLFTPDNTALLASMGAVLSEAVVKHQGLSDDLEDDFGAVHFARRVVATVGADRCGEVCQSIGAPAPPATVPVLPVAEIKMDALKKVKDDLEKKIMLIRKKEIRDMKAYRRPVGVVTQIWQAIFVLMNASEGLILDDPPRSWKAIVTMIVEAKSKDNPVTTLQRMKDFNPTAESETAPAANDKYDNVTSMCHVMDKQVRRGSVVSVMLYLWVRLCLEMRSLAVEYEKEAPAPEAGMSEDS